MLRLDPLPPEPPAASARHPGQPWAHLPQPELPPPLPPRPPAPAAGPSGLEWQPTPALYAMSSSATVPSIGHLRVVISKLICGGRRVLGGLVHPQRHRPYLALTWNSAGLCTGTSAPRQPRLRCPATLHTVRCPAAPRRATRSSPLPAGAGTGGLALPLSPPEPPSPPSRAILSRDGPTRGNGPWALPGWSWSRVSTVQGWGGLRTVQTPIYGTRGRPLLPAPQGSPRCSGMSMWYQKRRQDSVAAGRGGLSSRALVPRAPNTLVSKCR